MGHDLKGTIDKAKVVFCGDIMLDNSIYFSKKTNATFLKKLMLSNTKFILLTMHRHNLSEDSNLLKNVFDALSKIITESNYKIVFPVHPRTRKVLDIMQFNPNELILLEPQPYLEFIYLIKNARGIITDSGGITEEATVLNIPCITMRNSTERPETVLDGTNELVGDDLFLLSKLIHKIVIGNWKTGGIPDLWDGKTSERIVDVLIKHYSSPILAPLVH